MGRTCQIETKIPTRNARILTAAKRRFQQRRNKRADLSTQLLPNQASVLILDQGNIFYKAAQERGGYVIEKWMFGNDTYTLVDSPTYPDIASLETAMNNLGSNWTHMFFEEYLDWAEEWVWNQIDFGGVRSRRDMRFRSLGEFTTEQRQRLIAIADKFRTSPIMPQMFQRSSNLALLQAMVADNNVLKARIDAETSLVVSQDDITGEFTFEQVDFGGNRHWIETYPDIDAMASRLDEFKGYDWKMLYDADGNEAY